MQTCTEVGAHCSKTAFLVKAFSSKGFKVHEREIAINYKGSTLFNNSENKNPKGFTGATLKNSNSTHTRLTNIMVDEYRKWRLKYAILK